VLFTTVILPDDERRSIERNFQIITALQTQVQGPLSAGVYDGRKNFFSPIDLGFESGSQEVRRSPRSIIFPLYMLPILQFVIPMGAEFTVRLTIAASINPEYALFQSSETDEYPFDSQSPPALCERRTKPQ